MQRQFETPEPINLYTEYLNLTQLDHSLTEGAIESLIRGLRN